jgi:hypothetical protein
VASDLCIDLWRPLDDLTPQEAISNIFPTVFEQVSGVVNRSHLIDDYALSRNIAKYGLKVQVFRQIFEKLGYKDGGSFFYHHYLFPTKDKVVEMQKVLRSWKVVELMGYDFPDTPIDRAERIQGWMSRPELEWLYEKAKTMKDVVAIGNFLGRSTYVLCAATRNGDGAEFLPMPGGVPAMGRVYAVDPFVFGGDWSKFVSPTIGYKAGDDFLGDFLKNCGHFPNLTVIKKTSLGAAALEIIPPEVDMVFIDGDHSYEAVKADLKAWGPRTRKLICGHDFNDPLYPGVRQAVYEYFGADSVKVGPDSLWSAYAD